MQQRQCYLLLLPEQIKGITISIKAGASCVPEALLALFALAPDAAVGAHAGAAAVAAVAPLVVMLADAGAPAVLGFAPAAVMLADAGAPAVLGRQARPLMVRTFLKYIP
jgi:hypothetical protein